MCPILGICPSNKSSFARKQLFSGWVWIGERGKVYGRGGHDCHIPVIYARLRRRGLFVLLQLAILGGVLYLPVNLVTSRLGYSGTAPFPTLIDSLRGRVQNADSNLETVSEQSESADE